MSGSGILVYRKDDNDNISFLVLKCIDNKNRLKAKCYDIPKGSIDPGENYFNAAVREMNEEVGLDINDIDFLRNKDNEVINFMSPLSDGANSLHIMIAKIKDESIKNITLDKNPYDEHESFEWKNFYTCENVCLYFLKDIFSLGESLIKNHEH
jgi:8-oxo-dGTP pyrophosphatase MutT (NUDIX family)